MNNILKILLIVVPVIADNPCRSRQIKNQSVVCVCSDTYCDDIIREPPAPGSYNAYVSSAAGSRFLKMEGKMESYGCLGDDSVLRLDHKIKYQTILGFGGAITDAAGINWKSLSKPLQRALIKSYFSSSGLEYTFIRLPIGGSDFSTHAYAYNELPENDTLLTNYTLAPEDLKYKIPMIRSAMYESKPREIKVVASTWSPPRWMKTNNKFKGYSHLLPQYYQTYADYHLKFLEKYADHGIPVWALTSTNEPINGLLFNLVGFNTLGWYPSQMAKWLVENLNPTIRSSKFNATKLLTLDDQRYSIPLFFDVMVEENKKVVDAIDGIAVHYYADQFTPSTFLTGFSKKYQNKIMLMTEACEGSFPWQSPKVLPGSWKRATHYIADIIDNLNHDVVGWIDWNLCLNKKGNPNWAGNNVDSPIIVLPERNEFIKQPMFYALGHFSKFIPSGSKRISVKATEDLSCCVEQLAVITPRKTAVVVIWNKKDARQLSIKIEKKHCLISLEAESITTVEIPLE